MPHQSDEEALLNRLLARANELRASISEGIVPLEHARRRYFRTRSDADRVAVESLECELGRKNVEVEEILDQMKTTLGLTDEDLEALESEGSEPRPDHLPRMSLTAELIRPTANLDAELPKALEAIERLLPSQWLEEESRTTAGLTAQFEPDAILSLSKGLRTESEEPSIHRLRQAIYAARSYLSGDWAYDHFAGATLIPTIVQLGMEFENLGQVRGDVAARIARLWTGASGEVDARCFELLTAARCVSKGRKMEFVQETSEKSPDMQCHDPFPIVIECKRQNALSVYEKREEALMKSLFSRLRSMAAQKGICGTFELRLDVEAANADPEEIVATLVRQRLAGHPERELTYAWGSCAFRPLSARVALPSVTRAYSPNMLEWVFGWTTDLPTWDGICCSISNAKERALDSVRNPVGLTWINTSEKALKKRTWAPTNLFGDASHQIYPGSFGIIYVAYIEGARAVTADMRLEAYQAKLTEWEHSSNIRIPASFLSRLYPRPMGDGNPDLIESSVQYVSAICGDPLLLKQFPSTIFTQDRM